MHGPENPPKGFSTGEGVGAAGVKAGALAPVELMPGERARRGQHEGSGVGRGGGGRL
jgi:hypothetical protein